MKLRYHVINSESLFRRCLYCGTSYRVKPIILYSKSKHCVKETEKLSATSFIVLSYRPGADRGGERDA